MKRMRVTNHMNNTKEEKGNNKNNMRRGRGQPTTR